MIEEQTHTKPEREPFVDKFLLTFPCSPLRAPVTVVHIKTFKCKTLLINLKRNARCWYTVATKWHKYSHDTSKVVYLNLKSEKLTASFHSRSKRAWMMKWEISMRCRKLGGEEKKAEQSVCLSLSVCVHTRCFCTWRYSFTCTIRMQNDLQHFLSVGGTSKQTTEVEQEFFSFAAWSMNP